MYVQLTNNQPSKFPYTLADLRRDNPNTSFPADVTIEMLASFNVHPVTAAPVPDFDSKTHRVKQSVQLVDGVWTQVWHLQELPEQQASANIRAERNRRLVDCDWTQLSDAPGDTGAWATYRQALRDISSQAEFPYGVAWPEGPAN